MTLGQFDAAMRVVADLQIHGREISALADHLEEQTYKNAGIVDHVREPGFPCWTFKRSVGIHKPGYYDSPREALEALLKWDQENK